MWNLNLETDDFGTATLTPISIETEQDISGSQFIVQILGALLKGSMAVVNIDFQADGNLTATYNSNLLNDMMQSVIPAVYPLLKAKFGFSFAQIGLITLVFQMTSSILQPFVGRYADRHPRPYSLAAGMCFTLAGLFALALAPGFAPILLAVALIGWGSSIFHPESSPRASYPSCWR